MAPTSTSGTTNPLHGWRVDPSAINYIGSELQRPECILAEKDGTLWSADARGGVMCIQPDGSQKLIAQQVDPHFNMEKNAAASLLEGTLPNGLAFDREGNILISNFGTDCLEIMDRHGSTRILLEQVDGQPLGKVNFVLRDSKDRLWITVSTMVDPWTDAVRQGLADGYIVLLDDNGARIVADGLRFTNEVRLDAAEEWLYVAESAGNCVTRFKVQADGSLGDSELYGPDSLGRGLVDGIAFDAHGNLWAAMIFGERLIAITPEGEVIELLDDGDPAAVDEFERVFASGGIVPMETMMACTGKICPWLASITFGGPDLRTVYLGGLRATRIPYFRSPVAGLPMVHW
jgi:sugar lactone lactonase YvrE